MNILQDIKLPSNKKFGFTFSTIFFILAVYFLYEEFQKIGFIFFFLSILFLLISIFKASLLSRVNILWMTFGLIIGRIINPIIMGFIFFGIFTPVSLIFKIIKRDELELKLNNKKSLWKKPKLQTNNYDLFKNQF